MEAATGKRPKTGTVTFIRDTDPPSSELPTTFVDIYTDWAKTVTDAPEQYHRATSVVMLSTLLCPYVSLATSYGTIIPNIWMMILAGTTVTRKSTTMDLAVKMLDDVTDDFMLATDGSPEGLLTELAFRDGKASLFHRDEITGFMAQVSGRDYLSGLLESFTRLYDGKKEKRILRRESIEINNPFLVFLAGGIKTKMQEIVGMEHIRSGFLPRFLFITGSTTADEIRPIGPPPQAEQTGNLDDSPREKVLELLWRVNKFYTTEHEQSPLLKIAGQAVGSKPKPKATKYNMVGTPEAWERIRVLKDDAIKMGENSPAPELYTPLYDRTSNSVIKVAILLAAAELSTTIEVEHVYKAISLSQEWVDTVTEFAYAIEEAPEMDKWEKKYDKIVQYVKIKHPYPVPRTEITQKFRIRKRDIVDIEATLIERGTLDIYKEKRELRQKNPDLQYQILYALPNPSAQQDAHIKSRPRTLVEKEDSFHVSNGSKVGRSEGTNGYRIKFPSGSIEGLGPEDN